MQRIAACLLGLFLVLSVSSCTSQAVQRPDCSNYDPTEPPVLQQYRYPFGNAHVTYTLPADSTLIVEHRGDFGEYWVKYDAPSGGGIVRISGDNLKYVVYAVVVQSSDWKQELEWLIIEARSHGAITGQYTGDNTESLGLNPCVNSGYVP